MLNETCITKNVNQKGKKRKIMSVTIDENGDKKFTKDLSKIKCYSCGKTGHYSDNCKTPAKAKKPGKAPPKGHKQNAYKELKKQVKSMVSAAIKEDSSEDETPPPKKKTEVHFKVNVITTRPSKSQKPSSVSIIRIPLFNEDEDPDIILDSGAQVTALSKAHPVMLDIDTKSKSELVFAGGAGGKVDSVARIGDMTNVHCSSSLTNECFSIS